jgi:hypothetical protein
VDRRSVAAARSTRAGLNEPVEEPDGTRRGQPEDLPQQVDRRAVEEVKQGGQCGRGRVRPARRRRGHVCDLVGHHERERTEHVGRPVETRMLSALGMIGVLGLPVALGTLLAFAAVSQGRIRG